MVYQAVQDSGVITEHYSSLPNGTGNMKIYSALVAGGIDRHFRWSPGDSRVAYIAVKDVDNQLERNATLPNDTNSITVSGSLLAGDSVSYFTG